jgi:ABC-2 type transport system permease protein
MTAITLSVAPTAAVPVTDHPSVLPNLLRSEWAKIRSVRSAFWSLLIVVVAMIGVGVITSIGATTAGAHTGILEPIGTSLEGSFVAQFAIGVLAVLAVTSEYSTGMIRSTFLAAPQRRMVIAAKGIVIAIAAFTVGTVASLAAFFAGQAILTHHGVSLTAPGALRSILGVGLYLAVLGIFAVGIGTIIRSTAGAIATLFGLLLVMPALLPVFPTSMRDTANKLLPGNAGQAIFNNVKGTSALPPWAGLALFACYAGIALTIGLVLVARRDA